MTGRSVPGGLFFFLSPWMPMDGRCHARANCTQGGFHGRQRPMRSPRHASHLMANNGRGEPPDYARGKTTPSRRAQGPAARKITPSSADAKGAATPLPGFSHCERRPRFWLPPFPDRQVTRCAHGYTARRAGTGGCRLGLLANLFTSCPPLPASNARDAVPPRVRFIGSLGTRKGS